MPSVVPRRSFDRLAFEAGLQQLGAAIEQSQTLAPFCPIELVASGRFVSVMYLGNRNASQDLDFFLSRRPFGDQYEGVRAELARLIAQVASKLDYDPQWANDEVRLFLSLLDDPEILFHQSKQQDIVLYEHSSLRIYAVKWEWVLSRKLKRLQMEGQIPRREDWRDCIAITKLLYDARGGMLSPRTVQLFDNVQRESPVLPKTLMDLRRLVLEFHRVDALPVAIWLFHSSTQSFEYKWDDGTTISRDLWPPLRVHISAYHPDSCRWIPYNCDTQQWGEIASS